MGRLISSNIDSTYICIYYTIYSNLKGSKQNWEYYYVPDCPVEGAVALVVLSVHIRTGVKQQTYYLKMNNWNAS